MEFTTDVITETCFYLSMTVTFSAEYYPVVFNRMVEKELESYGSASNVYITYNKNTELYEWVISNNYQKMENFGYFFDNVPHKLEIFYGGDMFCNE